LERAIIRYHSINTSALEPKLIVHQTAVAVLTVGYMLAQLPSNMLITRVSPSVYLPIAAFLWSGISAATFACTNAAGLWGLQFILGITEAPLFPGAVFLMR
jgi:MFS family permease